MCILIIELIWVAKYGKMGAKPPFMGNFEGWYRYQTEWYTGTNQSGTGTK